MKINYDRKFNGLLIELENNELDKMAASICSASNKKDLLVNRIDHITYQRTYQRRRFDKSKTTILFISYGVLTVLSLLLIPLGLYQLYQIITAWLK